MKRSEERGGILLSQEQRRKGIFFVLAVVSLMAAMTFVGMSVDLGMITVTKTRMQSAADAAALGAAQEIVVGIREAGENGVTDLTAVHSLAAQAATNMAADICTLNGFTIDPTVDVVLGNRVLGPNGTYTETWNVPPYNMVKVQIRKTNSDLTADDGKLPLIFAPVTGERAHSLTTDAVAFIESRDIVAVLDYSGSMSFDSLFRQDTINRLGKPAIEDNLSDMWDKLVASDVRFSDDLATKKFPAEGFGLINSDSGTYLSSDSTDSIFDALGLGGTEGSGGAGNDKVKFYKRTRYRSGTLQLGPGTYNLNNISGSWDDNIESIKVPSGWSVTMWDFANEGGWQYGPRTSNVSNMPSWAKNDGEWVVITGPPETPGTPYVPFPQEGKDSNGMKGKPSESESESMWKDYINYVKSDSEINRGGYRKKYGFRSLMHYLVENRDSNAKSEDLWRVPIYPHEAMKQGVNQLTTFLDNLGFGDHLGLVTYATDARIETGLEAAGNDTSIDLAGVHLSGDVNAINTIQLHKQPGHYNRSTGIGYGLEEAKTLMDNQGRDSTQKAILLMTDGQSNQYPSGYGTGSLPAGWNWHNITDFNGDGAADLVIDELYDGGGNGDANWKAALHSFVKAKEAYDAGYIVHAVSMGDGADTVLMNAIAQMSGGEYVHIASGTSTAVMESQLEAAFNVLAGQVPPSKLVIED